MSDGRPSTSAPPAWHTLEPSEVAGILGVDPGAVGLSSAEAHARLVREGPNSLPVDAGRSALSVVLAQFRDRMIVVLLVAAAISLAVGEPQDALVIGAIVLLNALVGALQELRAEHAVRALRELAAPRARVRRDGAWVEVEAEHVVTGDLLAVEAGDVVTADLRVVRAADLLLDEAPLTGESMPVDKGPAVDPRPDLPVGDRSGLLHRGTRVTRGHGQGLVVATGVATELGRIALLLGEQEPPPTPLQRRLDRFGRQVAWIVLAVCLVVLGAGLLRGEPLQLMLLTAISLGVAAIPEALPAMVSVALALGARRMARARALVRRLPAVETLGSVTVCCTDKTGTLTRGRMEVESLWGPEGRLDGPEALELLHSLVLCNDAELAASGVPEEHRGDPTEVALLVAAARAGIDLASLGARHARVAEVPFDADRRRMSTVHQEPGGEPVLHLKGAPEAVLDEGRCDPSALDRLEPLRRRAELLAADGLRVLAVARRELSGARTFATGTVAGEEPVVLADVELERDLLPLGLVALLDPPREGAAEAVAECRAAGLRVVMITGDHPSTAAAIARRLAILAPDDDPQAVVPGDRLATDDGPRLEQQVQRARVFARASPEQKLRIVRALQALGEAVAMTGDGVNDAPALQRAEIGVAMGRSGTAVAREAADLVLLDDDFPTLVAAVREGRRIYDNVRKFVRFLLTSNAGEVWTLLLAPFLGLPLPLLPIQVLWVNLVTDGLPALALGVEPAEPDVMRRPPRRPDEGVLERGLGRHVLWCGLLIAALTLGAQAWAIARDSASWQTLTFTVLTLCQLTHVLAVRSERASLWRLGLFSNPALLVAVGIALGLQLAVVYAPGLQHAFHTVPLPPTELAVALGLPLLVFLAVELEKAIGRRAQASA